MYTIHLSIRDLVEAVYFGGDLVYTSQSVQRANLGSQIHRLLQKEAKGDYHSEVYLKITHELEDFTFQIDGRADGILKEAEGVMIEEIKTTYLPFEEIQDTCLVHFAQAYIYAYIYATDHQLASVDVQLTYYQIEDKKTKPFRQHKTFDELEQFFLTTLQRYMQWAVLKRDLQKRSKEGCSSLLFPFESYRSGQRKFAIAVYKTILDKEILFAQAPTGIGKTISTLFPALKAIGEGKCEKIFYLTAKNITAKVAYDTISLLQKKGANFKAISLCAKDKICFLEERDCDPAVCPYAKGYYDRSSNALLKLIQTYDLMDREIVSEIAQQFTVCPFELSLDASLYTDVIIADYNYVFDPRVYLKRFFTEKGNYVFLIDEAHNLVDRAREMYSAALYKNSFIEAKRLLPKGRRTLLKSIRTIISSWKEMQTVCEQVEDISTSTENDEQFLALIETFTEHLDAYFQSNHDETNDQELKQLYFDCINYSRIAEYFNEDYVVYQQQQGKDYMIKQFCMNPSQPIKAMLKKGKAAVFFSATLSPIDYYLSLLGAEEDTKRLSLPSPFDPSLLCPLMQPMISTRYANRQSSLPLLIMTIYAAINAKKGNYIVFAPSYVYMKQIYEAFKQAYPTVDIIMQEQHMMEAQRQAFLDRFDDTSHLQVFFCVIGGMFSEGIDLKHEKLIGAIIIGVGLAQINPQQDLIQQHFHEQNHQGFAYAYQFPGMNKVLQSAGRVIRSDEDKGMILFIDDRYAASRYRKLMPTQYAHVQTVTTIEQLMHTLHTFWKEST